MYKPWYNNFSVPRVHYIYNMHLWDSGLFLFSWKPVYISLSVFRYHESMLDCCASLEVVKQKGITFKEFTCLARCSGLDVQLFRLTGHVTQQHFRELVRSLTTTDDRVIVMSYSRKTLKQTGDGHFAPIGGYHPQQDLILVMDVARFKYPPHWVSLSTLWEAMNTSDSETGRVCSSRYWVLFTICRS